MDWRNSCPSNPYQVYHTFAFKPITVKFGKFNNFWMFFQMMCSSFFDSMDIEYSYRRENMFAPSPCSFRTRLITFNSPLKTAPISVNTVYTYQCISVFNTFLFVRNLKPDHSCYHGEKYVLKSRLKVIAIKTH